MIESYFLVGTISEIGPKAIELCKVRGLVGTGGKVIRMEELTTPLIVEDPTP